MNSHKIKSITILMLLFFVNISFTNAPLANLAQDESETFTVIYVDNSRPTQLSAKMVDFLATTMELNKTNFLLFLSDGTNPFLTMDAGEAEKKFETYYDRPTLFPDFVRDKSLIFNEIRKVKMSRYKTIRMYFFITENYFEEIIQYKPAYFIKLFPTELLFLTGNESAGAEINIYYTPNPDSKAENFLKNIDSKFSFYNNDRYAKNIKYTYLSK